MNVKEAKELLEKYGLKTDIKSVRERIEKLSYSKISDHYSICSQDSNVLKMQLRTADLDLICYFAEKWERVINAIKTGKEFDIYKIMEDIIGEASE